MKSLNDYLNTQLNESASIAACALVAAGLFCIPNGLYAIYQLIKRAGTKGAYDKLMKELDDKTQEQVKMLSDIDLSDYPKCSALIDAINNGKSYRELERLYDDALVELRRASYTTSDDAKKQDELRKIIVLHDKKQNAKDERRLEWLISPVEFFTSFFSGSVSGHRRRSRMSSSGSFGGGSTFGGGAGAKF